MDKEEDERVSWRLYYMELHSPGVRGFIPSPAEIEDRKSALRGFRALGLPEALVESVMMEDTPTIPVVWRMVRRYGVAETWRRCRIFIEED